MVTKSGSEIFSDEEDFQLDGRKKNHDENKSRGPLREYRKLKMPVFERSDAHGWIYIYPVERYFEVEGIEGRNRLQATAIRMEGSALSWYRWIDGRNPFRSWASLKKKLLERFQPHYEGSLYEQIFAVRQDGTAREYVSKFEQLAGKIDHLPDKILEGAFINGMKKELRSAVRVMQPETLDVAMKVAVMIDENHDKAGAPKTSVQNRDRTRSNYIAPTDNTGEKFGESSALGQTSQFKRLTEAELTAKSAKGLCSRCDGKFAPGHRCPGKPLQVLLVDDKEDFDDDADQEV